MHLAFVTKKANVEKVDRVYWVGDRSGTFLGAPWVVHKSIQRNSRKHKNVSNSTGILPEISRERGYVRDGMRHYRD
jgi:hypothetical protein